MDQYYVRVRGEVKGPWTQAQIQTQIRRKRIGRHHELSTDAVQWQRAGDMLELFEPATTSRNRSGTSEQNTSLISCSECSGQLSQRAETCPHCGTPTVLGARLQEESQAYNFGADESFPSPGRRKKAAQTEPEPPTLTHAGFWKRFAAFTIDNLVFGILLTALLIPVNLGFAVLLGASASNSGEAV